MTQIALHELQVIDSRINRIEQQRSTLPEKQALDSRLSELGRLGKLASDQGQLLTKEQAAQKTLEHSIAQLTEKITREEGRLYGGRISNPKELKGIEDETKALKAKRDREETSLLERIEVVDELFIKQADVSEHLQAARADADIAQAAFEKVSGEIDEELHNHQKQREEVLKSISPDTLKLYDRLRHEKHGLAVSQLDGSTCGGCHMELPAQELERIVAEEQVWRCPHCRRILVRKV